MFQNVKTKDGAEIHSIPMDYVAGDWKENKDHSLDKDCHCSPTKLQYIKPIYGDYCGEIYNHQRQAEEIEVKKR